MNNTQTPERIRSSFKEALESRILVLDGAMGTMIQEHKLEEPDYRGSRFANWHCDLKGNNDLLSLTRPDVIAEIHKAYLLAGADIIETNTFNSTSIAMADYDMSELSDDINYESARLARSVADEFEQENYGRKCFVAGVLGPTNRTASISPDVNDPGFRNIDFDDLVEAYKASTIALIKGGADIILIETIFDTLNAKAAGYAVLEAFEELERELPIMVSGTITDASGRTLSGQTTEAFYNAMAHLQPASVGLNCALGPDLLRQYVAELSRVSEKAVSAHPNAGLPNEFGEYDLSAEDMAKELIEWAESGFLNIVGGCCGTTPEHIRQLAEGVAHIQPRQLSQAKHVMRLSGLEAFNLG